MDINPETHFDSHVDPADARLRLADAMRRIIDELASSTAGDDAFTVARDLVEQAASHLAQRGHGRAYAGAAEAALAKFHDLGFVDYSPFIGKLNPLAPPIAMAWNDGTVEGHVTYGDAYEGPPGCLHGGFIAAGFDEVMGFTQAMLGNPGFTAHLGVNYRSPTPLHEPLRYSCRVVSTSGRKIVVTAELVVVADGRLCADCEGLFLTAKPGVYERMLAERPGGSAVQGERA